MQKTPSLRTSRDIIYEICNSSDNKITTRHALTVSPAQMMGTKAIRMIELVCEGIVVYRIIRYYDTVKEAVEHEVIYELYDEMLENIILYGISSSLGVIKERDKIK